MDSTPQGRFPTPRPFQDEAHEALREGFREGHRCQLIMAPTGAGKTVLGMRVIKEAVDRHKRAMFICDRKTLINQTSEVADSFGMNHGIVQASHWRVKPWLKFQIASAQTLMRREWPETDVIVVDEAHTQYSEITAYLQNCKAAVIGLSATPFSKGLGKTYTRLINATTMAKLVDEGILAPMRVLSCTKINMDGAKTVAGEWSDAAAEERGLEIVGDGVREWKKHAAGRKTIVFGATVAHCEELCRQFREEGVAAAVFTGKTPDEEREALRADFRSGALTVLISVEALAKGFDIPTVECVVDCRPLRKSLSTAIQMWGRGLRSAPGKTHCLLLDHSGNIVRFARDFERIYHNGLDSLDDGETLDREIRKDDNEQGVPACPKCGFQPFAKCCMACGHERQAKSNLEAAPGEMQEIVIGKTKYADDAWHLWQQCASYARDNGRVETQYGRACHAYREITGTWPPKSYKLASTPHVPVTPAVERKIKSRLIAYAKAIRKGR